jgi:hypothetical protein
MRPLKNAQFCSSSRKAKILTAGIYRIFRGLKFEPDTEIGQISADFERGCFSKVSQKKAWTVSVGGYIYSHKTIVYGPG